MPREACARLTSMNYSIPELYCFAAIEDPKLAERVRPASAIEQAQGVGKTRAVVITGPTGVGKSTLAGALLRQTPGGLWLNWHSAWDLFSDDDPASCVERISLAPAIVFDNLVPLGGVRDLEYQTDRSGHQIDDRAERARAEDWDQWGDVIEQIFWRRFKALRQTIVTTCLTRREVQASYSIPTADAVFGGAIIELDPTYNWHDHHVPVEMQLSDDTGIPF